MGVNSIPSGPPHARPMGVHRTCGEPDKIKKGTHPRCPAHANSSSFKRLALVTTAYLYYRCFRREQDRRIVEVFVMSGRVGFIDTSRPFSTSRTAVHPFNHGGYVQS